MASVKLWTSLAVLAAFSASAQSLPKHPTIQQVAGYRQHEINRWQASQLPANVSSALANGKFRERSIQFNWQKPANTAKMFSSSPGGYLLPGTSISIKEVPGEMLPSLQNKFNGSSQLYRQWLHQEKWQSLQGSKLLREIILTSGKNRPFPWL